MVMEPRDMYEFPNCMHALNAGLHRLNIDPGTVEIVLPHDEWWRLWCALESRYRGLMSYEGRGLTPDSFRYMGFTFRAVDMRAGALNRVP